MNNDFNLSDKVILITGGLGFLGSQFTKVLREAGARVIITDVGVSEDSDFIEMDVTNRDSISDCFTKVVEKYSKIDVVINNAAIDPKFDKEADKNNKLFENYPEELLQQSVNVNLLGYVRVAQEAVRLMLKQNDGNIINISSIYGVNAPDQSIYPEGTQKPVDYSITKGGVMMLTKWLASTYGKNNIRSNTYVLGGVFKGHDDEFQEKYGKHTAFGRMVKLEEIGAPLVFLSSSASQGMTGQDLRVDGGLKI